MTQRGGKLRPRGRSIEVTVNRKIAFPGFGFDLFVSCLASQFPSRLVRQATKPADGIDSNRAEPRCTCSNIRLIISIADVPVEAPLYSLLQHRPVTPSPRPSSQVVKFDHLCYLTYPLSVRHANG